MNGVDNKKAALNKPKPAAGATANGNGSAGQKKRRKGQDLKPIITSDSHMSVDSSPASANSLGQGYVRLTCVVDSLP